MKMDSTIGAILDWDGSAITVSVGLTLAIVVIFLKYVKEKYGGKPAHEFILVHDLWKATGIALTLVVSITIGPWITDAADAARSAQQASSAAVNAASTAAEEVKALRNELPSAMVAAAQIRVLQDEITQLRAENEALALEASGMRDTLAALESPLNAFLYKLANYTAEQSGGSIDRDTFFGQLWDTFRSEEWPLK
jgi:hypothetical protein